MNTMKRVLVMAMLLIAAMSLALTRGLPKEQDILLPHASASPGRDKEPVPGENVIFQSAETARKSGKEIRIIKKGNKYLLQIKQTTHPVEEYELTAAEKTVVGMGL